MIILIYLFKTNGEWIEINIDEKKFGKYNILTFINRTQLQVHKNPGTNGFELDLDHSFKDRRQKEIFSKIFFPFLED